MVNRAFCVAAALILGSLAVPPQALAVECAKVAGKDVPDDVLLEFRTHVHGAYKGLTESNPLDRLPIASEDFTYAETVWLREGPNKSNIDRIARIFGYALGQQLGYFDKGSRQHCRWLEVEAGLQDRLFKMNYLRLSVHLALQPADARHRVAQEIEGEVKSANKIFGAALIGTYDAQIAALTGIPVGKAPPYFGIPEKQVTIDRGVLEQSEAGKKYRQLTDEMAEIRENARKFEKGSKARTALAKAFAALKSDREELAESLKGISGMRVVVLGPRAVMQAQWIAAQLVNDLTEKPKWRGRAVYVWQTSRGDFEQDLRRPANALVSMRP